MAREAPEVVGGRFELIAAVGEGGTGTVYRARDRLGGPDVALKFLGRGDRGDADRAAREVAVLADLSHPGIVRYVAHGPAPDSGLYLAMEWVEGDTLHQRLERGPLSIGESIELARRVGEALREAHRRGVVHRDIKPSNLILAGGAVDRVKVVDFGLARLTAARSGPTQTGSLMGTPGYMAPEQARGEREVGPAADVFSLGCVLYQCLIGQPPFLAQHLIAVLAKVLLEEPPRLRELSPDIPSRIDDLVHRMLAKDPQARPADGGAVLAELSAWPESMEPTSPGKRLAAARPTLTASEQRVSCLVLAGDDIAGMEVPPAAAPTPTPAQLSVRRALERAIEPLGAVLEPLASGALVVALHGSTAATDQAVRAARCALAMRSLLPQSPLALVTGRGMLAGRLPVGAVIDRGVKLLRVAGRGAIRIDEITAGLLGARFEIAGLEDGLILVGEREVEAARTLLGRQTPCVGRERELGTLEAIFEECTREPVARAVLVTAPPGMGKSRLRQELLRRLRARGERFEVLFGQGEWITAGAPFAMLASALRSLFGFGEGESPEVRRQKLRARLARHLRGKDLAWVGEFIGEVLSLPSAVEVSEALRTARSDARFKGDAMLSAWESFLGAESVAQPLLILFDDLHWGDLPSVQFVDAALRRLQERPLMVVAFARPEVHDRFPGLWEARGVQEIRLGPLTRKASESLVRAVLGDQVGSVEVGRIAESGEGNAFYLEEVIRAAAAGAGDVPPETVVGMVQTRLDTLAPDARRVLRAASVFGDRFWTGGVAALVGDDPGRERVGEWLDDLARRELIQRNPVASLAGETEYVFRNELVREAAYSMLTDRDATVGHGLAGAWLSRMTGADPVAIAEHFARGDEPARAVQGYWRGAAQALEGNDWAAATSRAAQGIAAGASDDTLGALLLIQAEAYRWWGQHGRAALHAAQATVNLTTGSTLWFHAVAEAVTTSARLGKVERALPWLQEARETAALPGADEAQLVCLCRAGFQFLQLGRHREAFELIEQALRLAGELSRLDQVTAARLHRVRARWALHNGDLGVFLREVQAAVDAFERAGDRRNACSERGDLGFAWAELGEHVRAREALHETIARAEEMDLNLVTPWAWANLGRVLLRLGVLEQARVVELRAVEAGQRQKDRRLEGSARDYYAEILLRLGDAHAAELESRRAVELLEAAPPRRAAALATCARCLLAQARYDEAVDPAREALALLETLGGNIEQGEALVRLVGVEALDAAGHHEEAIAGLEEAARRLRTRAERITDVELRQSFLTQIPENAQTLALAREHLDGSE